MFSDTHFHYHTMTKEFGVEGISVLEKMAQQNVFFGLDIGTKCEDLLLRQSDLEEAINQIDDKNTAQKVRNFLYFSAGIFPDIDAIHNRSEEMKKLKEQIRLAELAEKEVSGKSSGTRSALHRKIVAIGEAGIDHHWNPAGVDGRCENDFDQQTYDGEKELFMLQLDYARELDLPFVVHSRDGFEDTIACIKEVGWNKGIIHCYSYGLEEAKQFLDLGWHIALGGSTTYTKKSKLDDMKSLVRYIPEDRLLLETDSPYLAPVPLRGTKNTPVNIEHTYRFLADIRGISAEELSDSVDRNVKKLFKV